jgi:hypothetical protein
VNEPLAPVVSSTAVPATAPEDIQPSSVPAVPAPASPALTCDNCGAALRGEYCADCGQRHEPHVHTLAHFASEAFESISHADSRLWRTVGYLLSRPGYLTREFFNGRRARYLPPFRLYLVISVLFFLIVGIPDDFATIKIPAVADAEDIADLKKAADELEQGAAGSASDDIRRRTAQELRKKAARAEAAQAKAQAKAGTPATADVAQSDETIPADLAVTAGVNEFCQQLNVKSSADTADRQKISEWCNRFAAGGPSAFARALARNLPHAMFVFLPLLALCMKLLYWRPKRYYVEHLLFLVHNHAFVFLAIIFVSLVLRIPYLQSLSSWFAWGLFAYIAWYIFRGMRNVYGQGRGLTFAKYMFIGFSYWVAALVTFMLTAAYSLAMI